MSNSVPIFIEQSVASDDSRDPNVVVTTCKGKKENLNTTIINKIVEIMLNYSYVCDGVKINSYNEYCLNYWKEYYVIRYYNNIFSVYYFDNDDDEWKFWDIDDYKEEIFNTFKNNLQKN